MKWLTASSQRKLKNKSLWSIFGRLQLKFPRNLGGQSAKSDKFFLKFRHFLPSSIFPYKNFFRWKTLTAEEFFQVKIKFEEQATFGNDIPIVQMVED